MPEPTPDETRVTLVQVARRAGVSPTTVSHVLSGKRRVAETTRRTVQEAIAELGYRPNNVARSLRTRRSRMVAVVVPDITNPFYAVLTRGLADAVDGAGYGTYVCNTDGIRDREDAFLADVVDRGVDGVVMAAGNVTAQLRVGPAGLGVPAVRIGGALDDDPHVDRVTPDDGVGSYEAVHHLVELGARRIAMIQGPAASGTARDEGYRRAITESGLPVEPELVVRGDWTRPGGRNAMDTLLSGPVRPDAVFCANDLTAIGAMDALRELGLSVPGDVAVVGFDDSELARTTEPPLTTVRQPIEQLGAEMAQLLLAQLDEDAQPTGVVLRTELVVRSSS
jgi:LacI family transcriptional regulator